MTMAQFYSLPLKDWLDNLFRADPLIDEILFDGLFQMTEIRANHRVSKPSPFAASSLDDLQDFAFGQGVRWDPLHPMAGGAFSVGTDQEERHYRWHGLMKPVARDGFLLSVRRHRLTSFRWADFIESSSESLLSEFLSKEHPVLILGETGSGKTSFLVSSLLHIAFDERVAILEQLAEIPKVAPLWIRLSAQSANYAGEGEVTLSTLVDELLRLRPDRLVIGELRREEILAFRRALLCGHGSVWTTLHARSAEELPDRLSELGGGSREDWLRLLENHGAFVVSLNRKSPRFRGLYQFARGKIISCL